MTNNTLSLNPTPKKAGPASPKPPLRKKRQQEVVVSKGPAKRFVPQKPPARQQRSLALETPKSANGADANVALERRRQQAVIEAQARKRVEDEHQKQEARRYEELEREAKARAEAEEIARRKAEAEAKAAAEAAAAAAKAAEEKARAAEKRKPAEARADAQKTRPDTQAKPAPGKKLDRRRGRDRDAPAQRQPVRSFEDRRNRGKLTLNRVLESEESRERSHAALQRSRTRERGKRKAVAAEQVYEKVIREVQLPDTITVKELAHRMAEPVAEVIKKLFSSGVMVTQNQSIDADTAELIVEELGHKVVRVADATAEDIIEAAEDLPESLRPRPPVVTVMGHVDHGKTSLLDAIRKTRVVDGEAGGITQHIGAYQVTVDSGQKVTFLDTPGHAAFTAMRERGAKVTDLVILVVAADDSVQPQTVEAINHARAAEVPILVAINKCDLPAADPEKIRNELLRHEIIVEAKSGDVLDVEVSATTGEGIKELLDAVILQSEILELSANPDRAADGAVIEAKQTQGRGSVATVLVRRGTLKIGDYFVAGEQFGKVRKLLDENGKSVPSAGPSTPVEVLGLKGTPQAGDVLNVVEKDSQARKISDIRQSEARRLRTGVSSAGPIDFTTIIQEGRVKELRLVVKADVHGSAQAIVQAVEPIKNDEVRVRVLHSGVGAITETDISLADTSNAIVVGFNVRPDVPAQAKATQKGTEIRYYQIIYDLIDDIKKLASNLLDADIQETRVGMAEILEIFRITGVGPVAGCRILDGAAKKSACIRLLRNGAVVHEGSLKSLKRFQDEVAEVRAGQECGMAIEGYGDIKPGDQIELFDRKEIQRTM